VTGFFLFRKEQIQMTSIADLPDDPKYTIKTVCTRTGIRPVTLRAWERRHEILTPHRSDNHYRLYSDRDVALLRWIKTRVDNGVSISSAAVELRNMVKDGSWPDAMPNAPIIITARSTTPPEQYANALLQALIQHNEAKAGDLLREVHTTYDLMTICNQVITPALVAIGEAWYRGEIRVTTEHFASTYLRGKLLSMMQAYPSRRGAPHILLGCAPNEQHEIGVLMISLLLRSDGYRVEFLGPDIPLEDLVDYASYEKPNMIILGATMVDAAQELKNMQQRLKKLRNAPIFGYGGEAFLIKPELRQLVSGIYLGDTLPEAINTVKTLLPGGTHTSERSSNRQEVTQAL
jgi:MerR family transcriptional regulator, light-induced transcriptional regulator